MPGAQSGVQWQVQAQVDPAALGNTPGTGLHALPADVHRVERSLPGQVQFVDNLSDSSNTAAGDALYAETLYIMLALPGALVGLGLAYLAALGHGRARPRASWRCCAPAARRRRDLLALAGAESVVLGVIAGLLGTGLALVAVIVADHRRGER